VNILFYQPYNQTVPYIESVAEQFVKDGHRIFFISHAERGETHKNLEKVGCKTHGIPIGRRSFIQYYKDRIFLLVKFCGENEIDIVYSHFQEANLISVLAQFFCKAAFVITRHHSDCAFIDNNWREKWGDKIINRLARVYIAPSTKVEEQIINVEKASSSKVKLINYGYNFDQFPKPDIRKVEEIRKAYSAKILLVEAARYITEKRHALLVDAMRRLIDTGYDIKLLLLGKGPLEEDIQNQIQNSNLQNSVFQLGFQQNVVDYFAAADLVVHFSASEASNSAIKEAAATAIPAAVCRDVGDFDDYVIHGKNGFLLNKENPGVDFIEVIQRLDKDEYDLGQMGRLLYDDVVKRFDIKNVIEDYRALNQSISHGAAK
jgi:glycosyltransferase involved in cell wall biosynthesis